MVVQILNGTFAELQLLEDLAVSDSSSDSGDSDDSASLDDDASSQTKDQVDGIAASTPSVQTTDSGFQDGRTVSAEPERLPKVNDTESGFPGTASGPGGVSSSRDGSSRRSVAVEYGGRAADGVGSSAAEPSSEIDFLATVVQSASFHKKMKRKTALLPKVTTGSRRKRKALTPRSAHEPSSAQGKCVFGEDVT